MASIVKRKNRYSVVYSYTDENGVKPLPPMLKQKSVRCR